jgi:hypothetical protein
LSGRLQSSRANCCATRRCTFLVCRSRSQIGLLALFQGQQDALVAVAGVPAHQRRALLAEFVQ